MDNPTGKQVDFATAISEMIGEDLPDEFTKDAYAEFIDEHIDEFYDMKREIRKEQYRNKDFFELHHSYVSDDGYCGEDSLNRNPYT